MADEALAIVVPQGDFPAIAELSLRCIRCHRDGTGCRVLAEQRTLRPAQDLHLAEIQHARQHHSRPRPIHTVDIGTHTAFERRLRTERTHTANHHRHAVGAVITANNRQAGHRFLQIQHIENILVLHHFLRYRSDCDRYILQALRALLRGNNNFLQCQRRIAGCRRYCNSGSQRQQRHRRTDFPTEHTVGPLTALVIVIDLPTDQHQA